MDMFEWIGSQFTNTSADVEVKVESDKYVPDHSVQAPVVGGSKAIELIYNSPATVKAIRIWADAIGQIPIVVLDQNGQPDPMHIVQRTLDTMKPRTLYRTEQDTRVLGVSYWWIRPLSIERLDPTEAYYETSTRSVKYRGKTIPADELLLFNFQEFDYSNTGFQLLVRSPLLPLDEPGKIMLASRARAREAEEGSIKNKTIVGVDPRYNGLLTKAMLFVLRKWFSDPKDLVPQFIPGAITPHRFGTDYNSAFINIQDWFVKEVSRGLDLPVIMLNDMEGATYHNASTLYREWYRRAVPGRAQMYEDFLNEFFADELNGATIKLDYEQVPYYEEIIADGQDDNTSEGNDE